MEDEIRVVKRCPECGKRLFDKISMTSGYIELKCPRCGAMVRINLALRRRSHTNRFAFAYQSAGYK